MSHQGPSQPPEGLWTGPVTRPVSGSRHWSRRRRHRASAPGRPGVRTLSV